MVKGSPLFPFHQDMFFFCQAQQRVKNAGVNLESDAMEVPCLSSRLQRCGLEAMITWPWLVEIVFEDMTPRYPMSAGMRIETKIASRPWRN